MPPVIPFPLPPADLPAVLGALPAPFVGKLCETKAYDSGVPSAGDGERCRIGESVGGASFRGRLFLKGFEVGYTMAKASRVSYTIHGWRWVNGAKIQSYRELC